MEGRSEQVCFEWLVFGCLVLAGRHGLLSTRQVVWCLACPPLTTCLATAAWLAEKGKQQPLQFLFMAKGVKCAFI